VRDGPSVRVCDAGAPDMSATFPLDCPHHWNPFHTHSQGDKLKMARECKVRI
jgi:hypothetical protein